MTALSIRRTKPEGRPDSAPCGPGFESSKGMGAPVKRNTDSTRGGGQGLGAMSLPRFHLLTAGNNKTAPTGVQVGA
jgi:hypothetical protein